MSSNKTITVVKEGFEEFFLKNSKLKKILLLQDNSVTKLYYFVYIGKYRVRKINLLESLFIYFSSFS